MSRFVQVGVTAMRDPVTGGFLPSVPLYVKEEDAGAIEAPGTGEPLMKELAEKIKAYKAAEKQTKRAASCGNS